MDNNYMRKIKILNNLVWLDWIKDFLFLWKKFGFVYNFIKVAESEKIKVLNINDLALAVRTEFLPGEKMELKITEKGSNRGQGIGYLQNGTMVVVEKAARPLS